MRRYRDFSVCRRTDFRFAQRAFRSRAFIDPRVLGNILIGHYHAPVREERAFLFVDLVGSTELAKKLGDLGAQRMLARFFFDISEPVLENGGEIHAYTGDEVIITWPMAAVVRDARCVQLLFRYRG